MYFHLYSTFIIHYCCTKCQIEMKTLDFAVPFLFLSCHPDPHEHVLTAQLLPP